MVKLKLPRRAKRTAAEEVEEHVVEREVSGSKSEVDNFGKSKDDKLDLAGNEKWIQEYRENRPKELEQQRKYGRRPTDIPLWITFAVSFLIIACNIVSLHIEIPWSENNNGNGESAALRYGIGLQQLTGEPALVMYHFTEVYCYEGFPCNDAGSYNGSLAVIDDPPIPTWHNQWCAMLADLQDQNTRTLPYDPWCHGIPETILFFQSICMAMSILMCCGNCLLKCDRDRTRYPPVLTWQVIPRPYKPVVVETFQCLMYSITHVFCGIMSMSLWTVVNNNWADCAILCFKYTYGFIFCTLGWCLAAFNSILYWVVHRQRWVLRVNDFCMAVKTNMQQKTIRYTGDIEFAATLMDRLGSDGRAALHWACALNRSLIINVLIQGGADISVRDVHGWTPLHWATRMGHATVINTLLYAAGSDIINARDKSGNTALMLCMGTNATDCASVLIAAGADIDEQNLWGQTLMMICAAEGTQANGLATVLLLHRANCMLTDRDDASVIHYAARDGNLYLIKLISQSIEKSDMKILCLKRDRFGARASDEAQIHGFPETLEFLLRFESYNPKAEEEERRRLKQKRKKEGPGVSAHIPQQTDFGSLLA
mmetsp:Transcript_20844/g.31450  ORF Transcript_20844/g.31450 Transcript_20844/m.31450 type:complete len:597 (-) Transcript_20844:80-1870(-)|eukprot:CAMPEP_0206373630 /NCGR_PEP_ID=MMETSP0294-20121207/7830_1 /ASSEMBLY_ACC=CAM_ASM_000327 /TAXON_ID=39354 /ORGANISM="Heterosigma akashiwo, Strain CCMP2393" /LENGTH=596 /DNA_ID=CAMNT_0053821259 /DNA_START=80 /DNA_END=1870 /DNA_ORIENTATION=+